MTKNLTIAEAAAQVCAKHNTRCFGLGCSGMLDEVAEKLNKKYPSKNKLQQAVGQALENHWWFHKKMYVCSGKQTRGYVLDPVWLCIDCGSKYGAQPVSNNEHTIHEDICGVCNERKLCAEPSDFGYLPDNKWLKEVKPSEFFPYGKTPIQSS